MKIVGVDLHARQQSIAGVYRPVTARLYLPQCTRAQWGDEAWLHLDGQLPRPGVEEAGRGVEAAEAEFPGAATHDGDIGPDKRRSKRRAGILGHSKADTTVNVYMQEIEEGVKQTLDAIYAELTATLGGAESG